MRIYTDGATSNNGRSGAVGGWAFVIINDDDTIYCEDSGRIENATNNICEMTAIMRACMRATMINEEAYYTIYSDSAYCINCYKQKWYKKWIQNGWINSKKQPVANQNIWEQLIIFFECGHFDFKKVEGHSSDKWNNYVDKLAVAAKEMNENS